MFNVSGVRDTGGEGGKTWFWFYLILIFQFANFYPQKPSLTLMHSKVLLSVNFEVRIT